MSLMVKLLSKLTTSAESSPSSFLEPPMQHSRSTTASDTVGTPSLISTESTDTSSRPQFEGESALSAHTAFANSLIERAVSTTPLEQCSIEMTTALQTLRQLVQTQKLESNVHETTYRRAKPDLNPVLTASQNPMPPIESVMQGLQLMKSE